MVTYLLNWFRLVAAFCLLSPLLCFAEQATPNSAGDQAPFFISFQAPGSTGTFPQSINDLMVVTGYYETKWGDRGIADERGFVRYPDGSIITFAVPGAMATRPVSINHAGDVTGYYLVPYPPTTIPQYHSSVPQGFVRTADGTITTFGNTPNGVGTGVWLEPAAINDAGEVAGTENDGLGQIIFTRSASGDIEKFSFGFDSNDQISAAGLNASGAILGYTNPDVPERLVHQGFLWSGNGTTTPIIAFGSTWTIPLAINAGEPLPVAISPSPAC